MPRPPFGFVIVVLALSAALSAVVVTATLRESKPQRAYEASQRGVAAFEQGDLERAEDEFSEAVRLDPHDAKAFFNLGLILEHTGRTDQARESYQRVLAIDARFEPALLNLAILVSSTDSRRSVDLLKRLIRLDRSNAAAHFNLGLLLLNANRDDEGREELRRAVMLDPSLDARRRQALTPTNGRPSLLVPES